MWPLQHWSKVVSYMYFHICEQREGTESPGDASIHDRSQLDLAGLKKAHKHLSDTEAKWEALRRKTTRKAFLVAAKCGQHKLLGLQRDLRHCSSEVLCWHAGSLWPHTVVCMYLGPCWRKRESFFSSRVLMYRKWLAGSTRRIEKRRF